MPRESGLKASVMSPVELTDLPIVAEGVMFNKSRVMKSISKISLCLAAVGVLSLSAGCTKDDVQQKPGQEQGKEPVPVIELSEDNVVLDKNNLEATYQFKVFNYTDGMPIVKSNVDWLTFQDVVKAESGENFQSFQFKMTAPFIKGSHRSNVTISYKNAEPKLLIVEQDNLSLPVIKCDYDYSHLNLKGEQDDPYNFSIVNFKGGSPTLETTADWLVIDVSAKDFSSVPQLLEVKISASPSQTPRSAEVKIRYRNAVQQYFIVEQNDLPLPEINLSDEYGPEIKIGWIPGREIMYKFGIVNYSGGYPKVTKCSDEEWLLVGEPEKLEAADNIQYFQCKLKVGTVDDFGHDMTVFFKYKYAPSQHIRVLHPGVG